MTKPTLKEAVEHCLSKVATPGSPHMMRLIKALKDVAKLHKQKRKMVIASHRCRPYLAGLAYYNAGVASVLDELDRIGIHTLVEDEKPTLPKIGQEWG